MFLYTIAAAGDKEALWLGELALSRGYEQVLAAEAPFLDRVVAAGDAGELGAILRDGLDKIDYEVGREKQAVVSASRLCAIPKTRFTELAARLDRFGQDQASRLRNAVDRRAGELGLPIPVHPLAPSSDTQASAASRLIVQRKRIGTLPLDDLSPADREGYPSGAWNWVPITALYWCDGHRSLAEVSRLTRLELGPVKFDFVGYFRFLAKHGYVDLIEKKSVE